MTWDPKHSFTEDSFRAHVYSVARETMRGHRIQPINGLRYLPYWWLNSEVRVFWETTIPREAVDVIVRAVDQRIRETIGAAFTFTMLGNHESGISQIDTATQSGNLDVDQLFTLALSEHWRDKARGGRQHADIYVTDKAFIDDDVSWAAASFNHGAQVYCLHGERHRDHSFLERVALHETGHLLGLYSHCNDYQNIAGLPYTPVCNMHYACTHAVLCAKCETQIAAWWQGVQDEVNASHRGQT